MHAARSPFWGWQFSPPSPLPCYGNSLYLHGMNDSLLLLHGRLVTENQLVARHDRSKAMPVPCAKTVTLFHNSDNRFPHHAVGGGAAEGKISMSHEPAGDGDRGTGLRGTASGEFFPIAAWAVIYPDGDGYLPWGSVVKSPKLHDGGDDSWRG